MLAANVCYDGSLEGTRAGESAFTPYVIQTVSVNGHEHRVGILGLENCDITRWDLPYNYPGLQFVHPGNDSFSMTEEVNLFLPEMRAQGCEFIILSYHGGLGEGDTELRFGENSERQALRIIAESHDIDLMINGHDHATGYSNSLIENADGRMIPVVNGGGEELTQTVFRFSENEEGALTWELLNSANLDPARYPVDEALQALVQPYAQMAEEYVEKPVATAAGEWDGKKDFYTGQTDSMDLIAKACIEMTSLRVAELADEYGKEAVMKEAGTDHLDTDLCISNVAIAGGYTVQAGPISMKDIYRLYSKNNSILVLPMTGAEIRAALEENAARRLSARVHDGQAFIYTKDELYTNLIFGGLNFTCDLAQPVGERIHIQGFSNGRAFEEDATYLAAVSNYLLGNSRCGLRGFSAEDALWSQQEGDDETAQSLIAGYLTMKGTVTPADFGWSWNITWSGSLEDTPLPEDQTGAKLVGVPQDGQSVVIFQEPEQGGIVQQGLKMPVKGCFIKPLPLRIFPAAPGRHDQDLPGGIVPADEIVKAAQPGKLNDPLRITEFRNQIVIFHLSAAGEEIDLHAGIPHPLHLILDDAVLQKNLLSPGVDPDLTQMIVGHQIRGGRLHMGADQHVGRQIHQIVAKRPPCHSRPELRDLLTVRAALVDYIACVDLFLLLTQVTEKPVRVIPGVKAPFHHQPEVTVSLVRSSQHRGNGPEHDKKKYIFQINRQSLQFIPHSWRPLPSR